MHSNELKFMEGEFHRKVPGFFRGKLLALLVLFFATMAGGQGAERPNILWILSEDSSKHFFKLFDSTGASTPHIEKLASEGLVFERAFSCSPVCSVARTTLMTSVYAPRIGTQFHRKIKPVLLPQGWKLFPAYLREAGYYTSNNSKTDYNTRNNDGVWDESSRKASWRKRPSQDTPFFHMQTFGTSHEGSLHFDRKTYETQATETDPSMVELAEYHPDTPLFRYTYARYHDRIKAVDEQIGGLVRQLEHDGLLEDTFVFFFGDHGGVLPGSKGYLKETGLHVPLVVRVPEKWQHLVDARRGERINGFVSFVDFGPTVLHLAGVDVPGHQDGRSFFGKGIAMEEVNSRKETLGYADRFDEKYEMVRSLRHGRFKYVRNYQGYYPDGLQNNYRYRMLAYQEWRDLFTQGELNPSQRAFFQSKPAEALYDIETDPYEVRNLAQETAYQRTVQKLRNNLNQRLQEMADFSFYPENMLVDQAVDDPASFAKKHEKEVPRLQEIADLALMSFDQAEEPLLNALNSSNPWIRYWALTVLCQFGDSAQPLKPLVRKLVADENEMVRVRCGEFLGMTIPGEGGAILRNVLQTTDSPVVSLLALQSVAFLHEHHPKVDWGITRELVKSRDAQVERRLEYLVK